MNRQTVPVAAVLWLTGLTLVWGGGWPAMKYAVGEIPVFTFRATNAFGGGIFVLALSALQGNSIALPRREWGITTFAAIFNVTGWFYFTGLGLTLLPAGRAAVIAYTMPLFAILAAWILRKDRLDAQKIVGLVFGLVAIFLLLGENPGRFGDTPLGVLAILAAAASWGVGTVIQKRDWPMPVLTLAGWQLLIGGVPMAALAVANDHAPFAHLTVGGGVAIAYVILLATGLGYWAWFNILTLTTPAVASIAVLAVPLLGVLSSAWVLGEALGWREMTALLLITAALTTVLPLPRPLRLRR
jgi:drug/metabolite transporter (DMT)-like permease